MGFSTNVLIAEVEHPDGFSFKVTTEAGTPGLARLNIACIEESTAKETNSQGVDLTPAECRALANMLLSAAELVEDSRVASNNHG